MSVSHIYWWAVGEMFFSGFFSSCAKLGSSFPHCQSTKWIFMLTYWEVNSLFNFLKLTNVMKLHRNNFRESISCFCHFFSATCTSQLFMHIMHIITSHTQVKRQLHRKEWTWKADSTKVTEQEGLHTISYGTQGKYLILLSSARGAHPNPFIWMLSKLGEGWM